MTRVLALLALLTVAVAVGCTRDPDPPRPPDPVKLPRAIAFERGGLGSWRGRIAGYTWHVDVDLAANTITATDPDEHPWTRTLEPREQRDLAALAAAARDEPPVALSQVTDYVERLAITTTEAVFEIRNNGPIDRPAAARLVAALDVAARWPKVE